MASARTPTAGLLPGSYHGDGGGEKQQVLIIRDSALYSVGHSRYNHYQKMSGPKIFVCTCVQDVFSSEASGLNVYVMPVIYFQETLEYNPKLSIFELLNILFLIP